MTPPPVRIQTPRRPALPCEGGCGTLMPVLANQRRRRLCFDCMCLADQIFSFEQPGDAEAELAVRQLRAAVRLDELAR